MKSTTAAALALCLFLPKICAAEPLTLPRAPNLPALMAMPVTQYPSGVILSGRVTPGDTGLPPLHYIPSNLACTLSGGNGDSTSQVKSLDNKCWIARFGHNVDVRLFGADPTGAVDSTAAFNTFFQYGAAHPGVELTCGRQASSNANALQYKIGAGAVANTPLFILTHPIQWRHCQLFPSNTTATTDLFLITPGTTDGEGWAFSDLTIYPGSTGLWRHTLAFSDGGNSAIFIRHMEAHEITVGPGSARTGDDINLVATNDANSSGFFFTTTFGPNLTFFRAVHLENVGDSVHFIQPTISWSGSGNPSFYVSNASNGAGEFRISGGNLTAIGGMILKNVYGFRVDGQTVFEGSGTHLTSPNNTFIDIADSINVILDGVQVQGGPLTGGGGTTLPAVLHVTNTPNVDATFVAGTNLAGTDQSGRYSVDAASALTAAISELGSGPYTYTATPLSCDSGALGAGNSVIAKYSWIPHTGEVIVHQTLTMGAAGVGTCSILHDSLPFAAVGFDANFNGKEVAINGNAIAPGAAVGSSNLRITYSGNAATNTAINNAIYDVDGRYKALRTP